MPFAKRRAEAEMVGGRMSDEISFVKSPIWMFSAKGGLVLTSWHIPDISDYSLILEGLGFQKREDFSFPDDPLDDQGTFTLYEREGCPRFLVDVPYAPADRSQDILINELPDLLEFYRMYSPMFLMARQTRALEKLAMIIQDWRGMEGDERWTRPSMYYRLTQEQKDARAKERKEREVRLTQLRALLVAAGGFRLGS
jgi:hypothetical protein